MVVKKTKKHLGGGKRTKKVCQKGSGKEGKGKWGKKPGKVSQFVRKAKNQVGILATKIKQTFNSQRKNKFIKKTFNYGKVPNSVVIRPIGKTFFVVPKNEIVENYKPHSYTKYISGVNKSTPTDTQPPPLPEKLNTPPLYTKVKTKRSQTNNPENNKSFVEKKMAQIISDKEAMRLREEEMRLSALGLKPDPNSLYHNLASDVENNPPNHNLQKNPFNNKNHYSNLNMPPNQYSHLSETNSSPRATTKEYNKLSPHYVPYNPALNTTTTSTNPQTTDFKSHYTQYKSETQNKPTYVNLPAPVNRTTKHKLLEQQKQMQNIETEEQKVRFQFKKKRNAYLEQQKMMQEKEKINYNDSMFVVENPENPDSPKSQKPISLLPEHKPETKYTYLKPEPDTISTISTNSGYGPGPETGHKPTRYTNKRTPLLINNFPTNITAGGNYYKSKLKQTLKKNKKYIKK